MSSSSPLLFFSLILISMAPFLVSADQFSVGGKKGWAKPIGNDSDTYNEWAAQHRFHVGDEALFKYQKDSLLVVNEEGYENCITSHPISKFDDGNTVFTFNHSGFFYFISGQPGRCKSGQRMIIRVMVHPEVEPPQSNAATPPQSNAATPPQSTAAAPPPKQAEEGGDHNGDPFNFGPPGNLFSGSELSVTSCSFMTAVVAAFVIICSFV